MKQKKILSAETKLNQVRSNFEEWRAIRKNRKSIPPELWKQAAALYPAFTINKISKTLSLNYTALKRRVEQKPENSLVKQSENTPRFIELDFPQPCQSSVSECVVEMEDSSGAKMKMCFRGKTDLDLLELGKAFWRRDL